MEQDSETLFSSEKKAAWASRQRLEQIRSPELGVPGTYLKTALPFRGSIMVRVASASML